MSDVDEYLKDVEPAQRKELEHIRMLVKSIVPMAEETISYGIPTYKYHGQMLLHVAAFKGHLSVFPGPAEIEKFKDRLSKFKVSKGTIQFTVDNPIPDDLIKTFVKDRLEAITGKTKTKE